MANREPGQPLDYEMRISQSTAGQAIWRHCAFAAIYRVTTCDRDSDLGCVKMPTVTHKTSVSRSRLPAKLEDLMNVGRSIAGDLRLIGIRVPKDLVGKDPYLLYDKLCRKRRNSGTILV